MPISTLILLPKRVLTIISVHYEQHYHLNRLIEKIKSLGVKAGVVLNPATPVFLLKNILEYLDFVLIMSVNPGFGGQKFILNSIDKVIESEKTNQ